jgi:hypothetical protein
MSNSIKQVDFETLNNDIQSTNYYVEPFSTTQQGTSLSFTGGDRDSLNFVASNLTNPSAGVMVQNITLLPEYVSPPIGALSAPVPTVFPSVVSDTVQLSFTGSRVKVTAIGGAFNMLAWILTVSDLAITVTAYASDGSSSTVLLSAPVTIGSPNTWAGFEIQTKGVSFTRLTFAQTAGGLTPFSAQLLAGFIIAGSPPLIPRPTPKSAPG